MSVLLLVQRDAGLPAPAGDTMYVPFATAFDAVIALKATDAPAVIVSNGLDIEDLEALATAVRERSGECIEVRFERWDGESQSPLSGACRGVISGFGADGVREAVRLLGG